MKTLLALALFAALSGCAAFDTAQLAVATQGAKANDEARETAEFVLCSGISVGAWRRAYASDPDRASGWAALCAQPKATPP